MVPRMSAILTTLRLVIKAARSSGQNPSSRDCRP
jgi:hypothetical protein